MSSLSFLWDQRSSLSIIPPFCPQKKRDGAAGWENVKKCHLEKQKGPEGRWSHILIRFRCWEVRTAHAKVVGNPTEEKGKGGSQPSSCQPSLLSGFKTGYYGQNVTIIEPGGANLSSLGVEQIGVFSETSKRLIFSSSRCSAGIIFSASCDPHSLQ